MRKLMIVAASAALASGAPAIAQQQSGLVNVNLSDIRVDLQNILNNNNVQVSVPAAVSVPIGIAAQICGVSAAVLAAQGAAAKCDGTVANQQTANAVARALQRR